MHKIAHAPQPFFNQLLKSRSIGRSQICHTVCMDQASLRLGDSLLTAWFNRLTLFRSSLIDNDLKTAPRPDKAEEKLMTFSELCNPSRGKVLSISRCAPTIAWLPKLPLHGGQCIFVHNATIIKLRNIGFCFACDECF